MDFPTRRSMLGSFIMWPTVMAASTREIIASVTAMEAREGVAITTLNRLGRALTRNAAPPVRNAARPTDTFVKSAPAISPDGNTVGWWQGPFPSRYGDGTTIFLKTMSET